MNRAHWQRGIARISQAMVRQLPQRLRQRITPLSRLHQCRQGATTLEWVLLLAAIALPSYLIIEMALATLLAYYQMTVTINGLPFP